MAWEERRERKGDGPCALLRCDSAGPERGVEIEKAHIRERVVEVDVECGATRGVCGERVRDVPRARECCVCGQELETRANKLKISASKSDLLHWLACARHSAKRLAAPSEHREVRLVLDA